MTAAAREVLEMMDDDEVLVPEFLAAYERLSKEEQMQVAGVRSRMFISAESPPCEQSS